MKFTKMKVESFLVVTDAEVNFADRGLVLIQGVNSDDSSADSNGAGKSSLADALCWALYGVTARGVTGDDVINYAAGKGTLVSVDIVDGDDSYKITRHRKHPKGKNSLTVMHTLKDGTTNDVTKGTDKLTQDVVQKILGASYEVFKGAIYAGQEQMPDLPAMTDKQLKVLIEEAAGVTLLENAYKEARERLGVKKQAFDTIETSIAQTEQRKTWIDDQILKATDFRDNWQNGQVNRINAAKLEVADFIKQIKALDVEIAKVDFAALTQKIADCDAKIAAVSQEGAKLNALNQEASKAQFNSTALTSAVVNAENAVARFRRELQNVEHKIGCACSECGRPVTEAELGAAKKVASERVTEAEAALTVAQKNAADAKTIATAKAGEATKYQSSMTDTSQVSAERARIQAELSAGEQYKTRRQNIASSAKAAGERAKAISAEVNPHTATIANLQAELKTVATASAELQTKLKAARTEVEVAESVSKVFSPSGVRAHILDEVTPFLNQQTAKYLTTLSDGNITANWTTLVKNAKGDLKEKFSIEVEKKDRAKSFAGLSGGEKRKVRIAASLALQDLVGTRASKPIDLFVGDEIDDALDPAGLERLMSILEDKAKERGSVFVISHHNLKDWISNIIQVETKGDKTVVTEVTA